MKGSHCLGRPFLGTSSGYWEEMRRTSEWTPVGEFWVHRARRSQGPAFDVLGKLHSSEMQLCPPSCAEHVVWVVLSGSLVDHVCFTHMLMWHDSIFCHLLILDGDHDSVKQKQSKCFQQEICWPNCVLWDTNRLLFSNHRSILVVEHIMFK